MREITVIVPTGVGDIFWVHQKLLPYYDKINYDIIGAHGDSLRLRSVPFLHLLPNVGNVSSHTVHQREYDRLIATTPPLQPILDSGVTHIGYSANAAVNAGIRLEDIDPGMQVAWDVSVAWEEIERPDSYILVYVSGSKPVTLHVWNEQQWAVAIRKLHQQLNLPIVMIGASYDAEVQRRLTRLLSDLDISWHIDRPAAQVCCLLKHADFFISYQSGLGVLADNYNTPQVMMYFHYPPLWYAWAKPRNIYTIYRAYGFESDPEQVI